jgi:hypothetical protein
MLIIVVYKSRRTTAERDYSVVMQGMMNTWTLQMGYPLVTFSRLENTSSTWLISQDRFLLSAQVRPDYKIRDTISLIT